MLTVGLGLAYTKDGQSYFQGEVPSKIVGQHAEEGARRMTRQLLYINVAINLQFQLGWFYRTKFLRSFAFRCPNSQLYTTHCHIPISLQSTNPTARWRQACLSRPQELLSSDTVSRISTVGKRNTTTSDSNRVGFVLVLLSLWLVHFGVNTQADIYVRQMVTWSRVSPPHDYRIG